MELLKKHKNLVFISVMVIVTSITYLNHFDNSFHFDDFHAINENPNIRSLKNIPLFFRDGTTISSLPQNQTYRPIVTTSLAFDYWLGDGYNPFYFHFITFIIFLLQGVLIFFFAHKIIELSFDVKHKFNIAAGIASWYMLHPVMAETVNYIIARSDLQSTFFVVLSFVFYQYWSPAKKYHLYLMPIAIGALSKPIAIMFAPLLFCYILLFEEKMSFIDLFLNKQSNTTIKVLKKTAPSIIFCILLYLFHQYMTPETFSTGSSRTFNYLITQPYVIAYYFGSSLLPIHLSADTDWSVLESIWSYKFFLGILFMIALISTAFICSKKRKYAPISFGIAWFFIALIPTSSVIPLAEVMNDHRMFFPYVGLIISIGYFVGLQVPHLKEKYNLKNTHIIGSIAILLLLFAVGTVNRNKVWDNEESLWKDVAIKSPKNGRGLMNYGLTLMVKGEYDTAEKYFVEAMELTPAYHTLYINLGILKNAQKNTKKAEVYFKKAIQHGKNHHSSWFYYGRFLSQNSRRNEAIQKLEKSMQLSPYHMETKYILMENYLNLEDWDNLQEIATQTLKIEKNNKKAQLFLLASIEKIGKQQIEEREIENNPTSEKYLNLSLKYYQKKEYQKCIEAAEKTILIDPSSADAYNNICTANNLLGNYDEAIIACEKALELNPNFQLAKNNLADVITRKTKLENLVTLTTNDPSEVNYLNLGLLYYNFGHYEKCIEISEKTILNYPNSDKAYNNLCAANNSLRKWKKAIKAGKKGLKINPNNQLLRNNYNWAVKNNKN